jgi:hypothetical protein
LLKKIQDAAPTRNEQILAFQGFEATISGELVAQWRVVVELWEQDPTAPNPFKVEKRCKNATISSLLMLTWHSIVVSEQMVRLQLAQEVDKEADELDVGVERSLADDHPSVVILNGLRIEDAQCVRLWLDSQSVID